jgi:chromosome segregation ATPase
MEEKSDEKGLFGTIGKVVENLIFEKSVGQEDGEPAKTPEAPIRTGETEAKDEPAIVSRQTPSPVDRKIYEKLKAVIEGKGNAFSQFDEMLNSLSDVITDEAMRYAAALKAVGKSYGITLDQIIRSMDVKLGALDEEKEKFSATVKQSENELDDLQNKIVEKDKSMESLRKQIGILEMEKKEIEAAVNEKRGKIEAVRKDFFSTADTLKIEIDRQKEIIMKYLQGGKQ